MDADEPRSYCPRVRRGPESATTHVRPNMGHIVFTSMADGDLVIPVSTIVEIKGVKDKTGLNGQRAIIHAYDKTAMRYTVQLSNGVRLSMKPKHVSIIDALSSFSLGYGDANEALLPLRRGDLDVLIRWPERTNTCLQFRAELQMSPCRGSGGPKVMAEGGDSGVQFVRFKPPPTGRPQMIRRSEGAVLICHGSFNLADEIEVTCVHRSHNDREICSRKRTSLGSRKRTSLAHASPSASLDPALRSPKVWVQVGTLDRDGVAFQVAFQQLHDLWTVADVAMTYHAIAVEHTDTRVHRGE